MTEPKKTFEEKSREGAAYIDRLNAAGVKWEDLDDPREVQRKLDAHESSGK